MSKFYSMIFFIEKYNKVINQKKITEQVVDKICDLLNCEYDKLGHVMLHPDHECKDIGGMYLKKNKERFYSKNIPSLMKGEKYPEEKSSPSLIFKKKLKPHKMFSDFSISIHYDFHTYTMIEIDIKESLLPQKNISLDTYLQIIDLLNSNDFIVNTSLLHYYSGIENSFLLSGIKWGSFKTFEEKRLRTRASHHIHDWENKIIDVFLYNTFRKECLNSEQLKELERIVGKNNVIKGEEYITFKYPLSKIRYFLEMYIPSLTKKRIRNFFKKNNMTSKGRNQK